MSGQALQATDNIVGSVWKQGAASQVTCPAGVDRVVLMFICWGVVATRTLGQSRTWEPEVTFVLHRLDMSGGLRSLRGREACSQAAGIPSRLESDSRPRATFSNFTANPCTVFFEAEFYSYAAIPAPSTLSSCQDRKADEESSNMRIPSLGIPLYLESARFRRRRHGFLDTAGSPDSTEVKDGNNCWV